MQGPQSFLSYRRFRHLKIALLGLAAAIAIYVLDDPIGGRSGGSVAGYVLGGASAALILWLMWFGVRKRSYSSKVGLLRGWLSAHVYLGISLLILVPLHSAFQFGWNVHTLAYALMAAVIVSGMAGVILYAAIPTPMTGNRPGEKLEAFLQQIADIDAEARGLASGLPDVFSRAVNEAIEKTRIGGNLFRRLSGRDPRCGTARGLRTVREHQEAIKDESREKVQRLIEILSVKRTLLGRVRRDVRYKALLDTWLSVHVPLSVGTLSALATHVLVVFYYW